MVKYMLSDITLMSLIDPALLNRAKIQKDFIYYEDSE
jgi:hypothetical protein